MYEAVTAHPEGSSTVARLALTAADRGYDGLVVRNAGDARLPPSPVGGGDGDGGRGDGDDDRDGADGVGGGHGTGSGADSGGAVGEAFATLADRYGVDLAVGHEIRAGDPSAASGAVGHRRPEVTVLAVRGGTPAMNGYAVHEDRVDVLARPLGDPGTDDGVDDALLKAAREHGVRVEFDLGPALREAGGRRVRALSELRRLRELVLARDAPFVVSARADSHLATRAPRDLVAVGEAVGFGADTVRAGLREWGRLVERNRERHSEAFVEPGVKRGRHEPDT